VKKLAIEIALGVIAPSALVPRRQRWRLLRALGLDVQPCSIAPGVFVGGRKVRIGPRVFINRDGLLDGTAEIHVGADVGMGPRVQILTSTHAIGPSHRRLGALEGRVVRIEDGVWLGAGVIVLPGVTVGRGCVVAAGAVVTTDCRPDGLYAGVPARRVRSLTEPS
jgi:maltose O-acetyltransferase